MADSPPYPPRNPSISLAVAARENLESITIAFILAFVFRAFMVEPFVIPTGSMADTLYGQQLTRTCSNCGYEYALGREPHMSVDRPVTLCCPNCSAVTDEFTPDELIRPDSGDRILVYKWPSNLPGEYFGPQRWSVSVFKDPRDGQTNFIKRLVGQPGEVLEIIDGDLYTTPIERLRQDKPELLEELNFLRQQVYLYRHDKNTISKHAILTRYRALNDELLPLMAIHRKLLESPVAQQSLWFNVYNHDFPPARTATDVGWQPESAAAEQSWDCSGREIRFASETDDFQAIRFTGKQIDDYYVYNDGYVPHQNGEHQLQPLWKGQYKPVGDVRVRFNWFPDAGSGGLRIHMNRDRDEFTAEIGIDGSVSIETYQPDSDIIGGRQTIGKKRLPQFKPGQSVEVQMLNLDYRVSLVIDGQEVLASNERQYHPSVAKLRKISRYLHDGGTIDDLVQPTTVEIAARKMHCRLRHLVLERDIYYRCPKQEGRRNIFAGWPAWGTAGMPMLLRTERLSEGKKLPGEYFMLGDNSPASLDSRLWTFSGDHLLYLGEQYQLGTVPEDQILGRAFFVYWPAGYRPSWSAGIGLIPNLGRMRWIR